jgi:hypothetical protein
MQAIREYFEAITPLSDDEWNAFSSKLSRQEFAKKSLILKEGRTEGYLSFIEEGMARFFLSKKRKNLHSTSHLRVNF